MSLIQQDPIRAWDSVQPEISRIMAAIKTDPANVALKQDLERVLSPFAIRVIRVSPNGEG